MAINPGVNVSKVNAYAVLDKPKGVNVTKANVYVVLNQPVAGSGVNVSKVNVYAVLDRPKGVNVSKAGAYAVLNQFNTTPPIWSEFAFPTGFLGLAYEQQWDMPTSALTVTYSVVAGSLPPGLTLSAISSNRAKISGIPTALGSYTFTLRATNTYASVDKAFTIIIVSGGGSASFTFLSF
jgi:hypothetical protein